MNILISSLIDVRRAANNRLHQYIDYLSEDHEITVICPKDTWRETQVDINKYDRNGKNFDCRYLSSTPRSPVVQEAISELYLSINDIVDYESFDIHLDYNTFFLGMAVQRRVSGFGIPTVYDIADDLPAMIRGSPQIPRPLRPFAGYTGEKVLQHKVSNADTVTYITPGIRRELSLNEHNSVQIPNGVDPRQFEPRSSGEADGILDTDFVVGFVGVTREWVDLECLVESIAQLQKQNIDVGLVIVGDEGGTEAAEEHAVMRGVGEFCQFTGTVPYEEVPGYINEFDVGVIPFDDGDIAKNSLPLKMFEYMACGIPVVSSHITGVKDTADDIALFADSVTEWVEQLGELQKNPDYRTNLGDKGRALVEESYSWEMICKEMEDTLLEAE